jgi:hypothetical protein
LALAKSGLRAPQSARARVRARLVESGPGGARSGDDSEAPLPNGASSSRAATTSRSAGAVGTDPRRAARASWRALGWTLFGASVGLWLGYWIGAQRAGAGHDDAIPGASAFAAASARTPADAPSPPQSGFTAQEAGARDAEETPQRSAPSDRQDAAVGGSSRLEQVHDPRGTPAAPAKSTRERPIRRSPPAAPFAAAPAVPSSRSRSENEGVDHFAAQVALLSRAERAIRAQEGALALSFLDELEREFPGSSLRVERDAARALARCQVTRTGSAAEREAARKTALELLSQGPSAYARRLRELCELPDAKARALPTKK